MIKYKLYLFSSLMLISSFANAQTSPFDKAPSIQEQSVNDNFITEREMRDQINQLRMDLEMMMMDNEQFNQDLPPPNSSILSELGDDAKLKIIVNGKSLKRDSEKYSISEN
jgi:hypothetical protein